MEHSFVREYHLREENRSVERARVEKEARNCSYNMNFGATEKSIDEPSRNVMTLEGKSFNEDYADAPAVQSVTDTKGQTPIIKNFVDSLEYEAKVQSSNDVTRMNSKFKQSAFAFNETNLSTFASKDGPPDDSIVIEMDLMAKSAVRTQA